MDLILVALQSDQPPARQTQAQTSHHATQQDAKDTHSPSAARDGDAQSAACHGDERNSEPEMSRPRVMPQMPAEHWEEPEDLYTEKGEAEHVGGGR